MRPYVNHPGFARANTRLVTDAVRGLLREGVDPSGIRLLFVTHSIPTAMDDTSGPGDSEGNAYARQHVALGSAITGEVNATLDTDLDGELVFCSRSGPPSQPWLEPDVNDRLEELAAEGAVRGGAGADRVRLRPHGGRLRPRHRGGGDGRAARAAPGARAHGGGRRRVRVRSGRPARGAGRRGQGRGPGPSGLARGCAPAVEVSARLLPQPARGQARPVRARAEMATGRG